MADLFLLPFRPAFDLNGLLAPGARLYFYKTGTLDPQNVYQDQSLTIVLPNPVMADAAGKWPSIYLDDTLVYRVILRAKDDTLIGDIDPYLPNTIDGLTEDLQALSDLVAEDTQDAEEAADRAYGFAAAIETVTGGYWYATLADGIADTAAGESFLIVTVAGLVQIGYNDGASGVIRAEFLTVASNTVPTKTQIETALNYSADVQSMLNQANDPAIRASIAAAGSGVNTDITSLKESIVFTSDISNIRSNTVGYRGLPQNNQTAAYLLSLGDQGYMINITSGGINIPDNSSVAFPIGSTIIVFNNSGSSQSISMTGTDSLRLAGTASTGTRTLQQYGFASLVKVGLNTWTVSGNVS